MRTWRRHRAQTNKRASSIAPPGEEGWTIRVHRAILPSEPYASADLGAASDSDGQVFTVRGCVGLFAGGDLTAIAQRRHRLSTKRRCPPERQHRFRAETTPALGRGAPGYPCPSGANDACEQRPTSSLPGSAPGDPELPSGETPNAGLQENLLSASGEGPDQSTHTDQVAFAKYARFSTATNIRPPPYMTFPRSVTRKAARHPVHRPSIRPLAVPPQG